MRSDSKLAAGLLATTTAGAFVSGLTYLNTAAAFAGFAFIVFVLGGVLAGSVVLRRLLSRSGRGANAEVKRSALHAFVARYNDGEKAMRRAARILGQSRDRMPPLRPAMVGLDPWVRMPTEEGGAYTLSGKSLKQLTLTTIQKQRTVLDRLLANGDSVLREAATQLRADLEVKLAALAKAGIGDPVGLPEPGPTGFQDLAKVTQTVASAVELTAEALDARIRDSASAYQPNAEAKALVAQATAALPHDDPITALDSTLQAIKVLGNTLKAEFHETLQKALANAKAARDEEILGHVAPALAKRVMHAVSDITGLTDAPLRGQDLRVRAERLEELMREVLTDLSAKVPDQPPPADLLTSTGKPHDWHAMAMKLVALRDASAKARKSRGTYLKVKDDISELLATKGSVTAKAVGLKDAGAIFEIYAKEHGDVAIVDGILTRTTKGVA